ncbi:MAG: FkbM family methyltransferase [Pseudonocardiales bacterium]|nr:MAG: FkbM family methyltransferase [Pseudonocardiales bacterium]
MPTAAVRAIGQIRSLVNRAGFDLTRENFRYRFVHGLAQHGITAVLDIGANTGQFGRALRRAKFAGRIVSLEPLPAAFEELLTHARADAHWTAERAAVSDHAGALRINVAGNSVSSSALPMLDRHATAAPGSRYVATQDVVATTVDDIVTRHALVPESTLLKIDVQGYEKSVLDGAANSLPGFGAVRTEMSLVALYDGQALLPEIIERLGECGLDLWFVEPGFVEPGTRRLLQLDGTFFRRDVGVA